MKRKFDVKLRKVGNSYVVTIPMDSIERFDIKEGDILGISFDSDDIKRISPENKSNEVENDL